MLLKKYVNNKLLKFEIKNSIKYKNNYIWFNTIYTKKSKINIFKNFISWFN